MRKSLLCFPQEKNFWSCFGGETKKAAAQFYGANNLGNCSLSILHLRRYHSPCLSVAVLKVNIRTLENQIVEYSIGKFTLFRFSSQSETLFSITIHVKKAMPEVEDT